MAEISPLRRRMIEDMTVRNLSPRRNNRTSTRYRSSAAILVVPLIVLAWKMSTPFQFIWLRRGSRGLR
jgi:hypothetical protein